MKRKFRILIVGGVIIGLTLSLVGMTLVSQAASVEKNQNSDRQAPKPIPATDVKVIRKIPFSMEVGRVKGKPTPSGKDKNNGPAATGILGATTTGAKYAIVIGICDYPGTENDICLSDGDSYNMRKTLIEKYGYESSNIKWFRDMGTTTNEYGIPSRANIYNAIMDIKTNNATSGSEVVFFFSRHGADGIARDGDSESRDEGIVVHDGTNIEYIWDGELRDWFTDFPTKRVVFVFDSCLAGGMNDVADAGRVVAMATGETQPAYVWSDGELGEGFFSHYFVNEGMYQGLADTYDSIEGPDVTVEEAFDYAKAKITIPRQVPVISDKFTNDLLL
jgi:hypothetical protein